MFSHLHFRLLLLLLLLLSSQWRVNLNFLGGGEKAFCTLWLNLAFVTGFVTTFFILSEFLLWQRLRYGFMNRKSCTEIGLEIQLRALNCIQCPAPPGYQPRQQLVFKSMHMLFQHQMHNNTVPDGGGDVGVFVDCSWSSHDCRWRCLLWNPTLCNCASNLQAPQWDGGVDYHSSLVLHWSMLTVTLSFTSGVLEIRFIWTKHSWSSP